MLIENIPWYKRTYDNLMETRRNLDRTNCTDYLETHHIIPRCLGGTNDKDNLIKLTVREHIIAHLLLMNIYPSNLKLLWAVNCMINCRQGEKYFSVRELAKQRERMSGKNNPMYGKRGALSPNFGKKLSEDTKRKISQSKKGKTPNQLYDEERREKIRQSNRRRTISLETREKISKGRTGKLLGKNNPMSRKEVSIKLTGERNGNSRKVIDSETGHIYGTISECAKSLNVDRTTIHRWIKLGKNNLNYL